MIETPVGSEVLDFQSPAYDLYEINPVWTFMNIVRMLAGPKPVEQESSSGLHWTKARGLIRHALMGAIESGRLDPINKDWLEEELRINASEKFVRQFEENIYERAKFKREDAIEWVMKEQIVDTLKRQGHQIPSETIELIERIEGINQNRDIESSSNEIKNSEKNGKELVFRRNGDTWQVGFENVKNIKHSYGMTYIQYLLTRPNKEISCFELELAENRKECSSTTIKFFNNDENEKKSDENPSARKSIDRRSTDRSFYELKNDLRDAKNAVEQAEEEGGLEKDLLQEEYQQKLKYFEALYDKNWNLREDNIEEDKARKRVSKAIQTAKNKIIHHLPELEEILKHIQLGHYPVFNPPIDSTSIEIISR